MPYALRVGRLGVAPNNLYRTAAQGYTIPGRDANTLMCWVRFAVVNKLHNVLALGSSATTTRQSFGVNASGFATAFTSAVDVASATALTAGVWYHMAQVQTASSGTAAFLYVNGVQVSSQTAGSSTVERVIIGNNGNSTFLDADVAAIKVYNRGLSAAEVMGEMPYAVPVSRAGINWAIPMPAPWDDTSFEYKRTWDSRAASQYLHAVDGQPTGAVTSNGTIDSYVLGPPIQYAPPGWARRRTGVSAAFFPPVSRIIQRPALVRAAYW